MRWVVVALMLFTTACLQDNLVECSGGYACAAGAVCDDIHDVCIAPEQATACSGLAAGAPCAAGSLVGVCLDGVCLQQSCGDRVVEGTEACDDGNHANGDGCNATCTSTERCGDGILDPTNGEACDDGNLISGDGCDSQCATETEQWTIEGIAPVFSTFTTTPGHIAYDSVHHQILYVMGTGQPITWAWTGDHWNLLSATGLPGFNAYRVKFDPDAGSVFLIGTTGFDATTTPFIARWNGSTWLEDPATSSSPHGTAIVDAAYDETLKRFFVVTWKTGGFSGWLLDVTAGTWTSILLPESATGSINGVAGLAFDAARGKMIALALTQANVPRTYEWNGSDWDAYDSAPPTDARAMVFDPDVGGVIVVGGWNFYSQTIAKWNGTTWDTLPFALPDVASAVDAIYDTSRSRLCVLGGTLVDTVLEWDGSAWAQLWGEPTTPTYGTSEVAVYDVGLRRLTIGVPQAGVVQTWLMESSWRRVGDAYTNFSDDIKTAAYDPTRGHIVAVSGSQYDGDDVIEQLVGDTWELIHPSGNTEDGLRVEAMTFDPTRQVLVGADTNFGAGTLATTATDWAPFSTQRDGSTISSSGIGAAATMAFDPRTSALVVTDSSLGHSYELADSTWSATLSPASLYTAVTDERRGSVLLIGPGGTIWERIAGTWSERAGPPISVTGVATYDPINGELHVIGFVDRSWMHLRRRFVGPHPLETCVAGEDADGDGLAGCDDPECWWACGTCPPYATCP